MSATTTAAAPAPLAGRPAATGRTVLRLHRSALIVWLIVVAAAAGSLLWAYGPGATDAWNNWRQQCPDDIDACMWDTTINGYYRAVRLPEMALTWLCLPVAAWAGAALIGRELENGTAKLAWTQSVSPARWLVAELAVPAALLTAGTTVLVVVHRLVFEANPFPVFLRWAEEETFVANGPVALALPLCALAVGALTGLLLRRTLPALALGTAVTWAVVHVADLVTPDLWPWKTATGSLDSGWPNQGDSVLYGDQGMLTSTGARIPYPTCGDNFTQCMADHNAVAFYADYHPSSAFWPLQLIQTGILLGVAAIAVGAAFWLLRRKTGPTGAAA
ncbi:hypothetical protein DI272_21570 [Streptomyces sp. Act143]|uniref:hypothetical protein n=1 Tax=Streptomyces sp. Act143 TaxID=2200760 RepID=UPI000D674E3F|nr:hypothetical protein [Streptomyces sp. Act143]PWI16468.1 hypothetical protein DI272_21570 [Streptomyces sp. Act143]